jgi:acetyl esterase/lipase
MIQIQRDFPYRTPGDAERHVLDVYHPANATKAPVLMLIHGGVWKQGHKRVFAEPARRFAESGLVVVCPNYRLSPAVKHPAHAEDIAKAFAVVAESATKWGGDPQKIVVAGHSAGGHLAALLATDDRFLKAHQRKASDIRGTVGISGVYAIRPTEGFTHAFPADAESCRDASPMTHVNVNTCPMLLVHADRDLPFMKAAAEQFAETLKKAKRTVTVREIAGRDHHSIVSAMKESDDPLGKAIIEFVGTVTKP